jgi:hypothetical protein
MTPPGAGENGIIPDPPKSPRRLRAVDTVGAAHAPRTPERPPNNLPLELSSFVAREKELAEVKRLLENTRLLTLTGPGGAGKTRLALAAAFEMVGQFEDGVWWVGLASLADPALVPQSVTSALGCASGRAVRLSRRSQTTSEPGRCCWYWTTASIWSRRAPSSPRRCSTPVQNCVSWLPAGKLWASPARLPGPFPLSPSPTSGVCRISRACSGTSRLASS